MKRYRLELGAIGVLALAIRSLYLWQIRHTPFFDLRLGDGQAYHLWAKRIAAGDWLGDEVFYQTPLYPYFLAVLYRAFDDSVVTVRAAQALLGAASCVLLSYAGWRLFGRRGLLAGAILAVYPPAIFLDGSIDKTALSTTLLCGLLALFAAKRWLAAGIALGFLALTRENALLLAIPIFFVARGRSRLHFAAGVLAVLAMVGIRNLEAGGEFHITTAQFGTNLFIGNHAGAPGYYEPLVTGHGSAADERVDATRLAAEARGRNLPPGEVSRYWTGRALEFATSHPADWLVLTARKIALILNNAEIADTESQSVYADWSWLLRLPLGFGLVLGAAVLNWRGERALWAMAAVYVLAVAIFYVLARYRFPLVPILLLLAVSRAQRPSRFSVAAAAAVFGVAFLPLIDARPARAVTYHSIATALSRDPARLDQAAEFFRRALEVDARFPGARYGLATVLLKQGRPQEAIPHFEDVVTAWPDYEEAHYNLGVALAEAGRTEEAAGRFSAALRLREDDAAAHSALAQSLLRMGRKEEAVPHLTRALELNTLDASAHANLGAILANEGRFEEAIPHFERAAALDPADDRYRRNLEEARRMR